MILVVDDDKSLARLLKITLENNDYVVQVAHEGESAYRHLRDENLRLILLDISMPGINGAELLMLMASEGIEIPVIIMAGFPDFSEDEMKDFGNVKKLFHKPFYTDDILKAVQKYALPDASA